MAQPSYSLSSADCLYRETAEQFGAARHRFAVWELSLSSRTPVAESLANIIDPVVTARSSVLLKCMVFARSLDLADAATRFLRRRKLTFGEVLLQPPLFGSDLVVCLWLLEGQGVTVSHQPGGVRVAQGELEWHSLTCHSGAHLWSVDNNADVGSRVAEDFSRGWAAIRARTEGGVADVVRTWLFVPDINGLSGERSVYQELNRARSLEFSRDYPERMHAGRHIKYPASTGIGTSGPQLHMSALACGRSPAVTVKSIENPRQLSAYVYSRDVSPIQPLFARAVLISTAGDSLLLVSGTASIVGEESIHAGSAANQTRATLENIASLIQSVIGEPNTHIAVANPFRFVKQCIVYIRNAADADEVRRVCQDVMGHGSVIAYVCADICRPELLVEIEAIAIFRADSARAAEAT